LKYDHVSVIAFKPHWCDGVARPVSNSRRINVLSGNKIDLRNPEAKLAIA